jgi:hypothetical protein
LARKLVAVGRPLVHQQAPILHQDLQLPRLHRIGIQPPQMLAKMQQDVQQQIRVLGIVLALGRIQRGPHAAHRGRMHREQNQRRILA